jgi:predicted dinucleotide-binding enzyme
MKVGIIGAGNIGRTVAGHLVTAGHEVALSNSRGPESLSDAVAAFGPRARAATVEEAAAFGDLVLEAVPFGAYDSLPGAELAGKTVVSASNYYPDRDGDIDFGGRTQTELIAAHLTDSTVVKAFNTMYYETLRDEARPEVALEDRLVLFLAGDSPGATGTVADLIEEVGFAALDVGGLADSGVIEPRSPLYNEPMHPDAARAKLEELRG